MLDGVLLWSVPESAATFLISLLPITSPPWGWCAGRILFTALDPTLAQGRVRLVPWVDRHRV